MIAAVSTALSKPWAPSAGAGDGAGPGGTGGAGGTDGSPRGVVRVVVCGHSLGGALATLLGLHLAQHFNSDRVRDGGGSGSALKGVDSAAAASGRVGGVGQSVPVHVVTFGAPCVGNEAFGALLEAAPGLRLTRLILRNDPVPASLCPLGAMAGSTGSGSGGRSTTTSSASARASASTTTVAVSARDGAAGRGYVHTPREAVELDSADEAWSKLTAHATGAWAASVAAATKAEAAAQFKAGAKAAVKTGATSAGLTSTLDTGLGTSTSGARPAGSAWGALAVGMRGLAAGAARIAQGGAAEHSMAAYWAHCERLRERVAESSSRPR